VEKGAVTMRVRSKKQTFSRVLPVLVAAGAGCEMADFGYKDRDDDLDAKSLVANLSGKNEVPPADPDGSGVAMVSLSSRNDTLCFDLAVEKVQPVLAAHVHQAPAGSNGPIVVDFGIVPSDPTVCDDGEGVAVLRPSDGAPGFGQALAFEGDTALVSGDDGVYVLVLKGGAWSEQQKLAAPEPDFGRSVALSGHTAAIGAEGAVRIYVRRYGAWSVEQVLAPPDGVQTDFGRAVAVSGDTLLVGAPGRLSPAEGVVDAHVFERRGSVWTETAALPSLLFPAGVSGCWGCAVALAGDFALVGSPLGPVRELGFANIFERSSAAWTKVDLPTRSEGAVSRVGTAVALSGKTALVTAPGNFVVDLAAGTTVMGGTAEVFERADDGTWVKQQMAMTPENANRRPLDALTASDAASNTGFGSSAAVSGDVAVVGAPGPDNPELPEFEAAYVYARTAELWSEIRKLTPPKGAVSARFGTAVAVSGTTVLVGAPKAESAVFAYELGAVLGCELPVQRFDGCVDVDRDLLNAIRKRPEQYYVNVHTREFPEGAVRGQLERDVPHGKPRSGGKQPGETQ
jgi:hypothetical protein